MTKKNEWEIQRDKQNALRAKTMKSLTADQLNAIKQTHKTLSDALDMLRECNDLYLSDIRKLDDAFWQLKNQFVLENGE
jgi:hypothetical protein|tara:strand:- start:245 stop:481 length:237 start_codon:yes stop_codon:yes gene_type:complete